ncbi:nitrogenase iron-molybdenum cofactor biosynthesis protein NifN [Gluconacetobacter azotocaptans]|uniref:nitrogenase iron-molybdenum cofactor biosynthesis protein NifN n=1 Tax=Gluconacetobacter azotocaptans TaxID=142834 RepID=UPI00195AEC99|nr:nitrogenase iron-molybdenum cofactor biosynthesis protein NifN [Gluconacetobacter azotocaptans]MBM9400567.1 nitrogenase iron-molybdenum cofactor biosynthesis protein NifN [Gluconacetobacter azotocaptans]
MAKIIQRRRAVSINPLKSSAPLGAALAYLGIDGSIPLLHGSQGCTSFALVLLVRHFKETIPLQTTAMEEVATILGGSGNMEEALLNLTRRVKPRFIGIASTALVETRGEDYAGDLKLIMDRQPELAHTRVVFASTPDYAGALEDGWARAVSAVISSVVLPWSPAVTSFRQVNILPGVHQTPADIEALKDMVESFGLYPVVLPDVSGSLDGHVADAWIPTTMGGARLEEIEQMARATHTIAIGEHMRAPAELLGSLTGVPLTVFTTLTGLAPCDRLVALLSRLSGNAVPGRYRRERSQLVDAMLDGHFHFGGRRIAIGADPDLLFALSHFFAGMGAEIVAAVASTGNSPSLDAIPAETVMIGDLTDLEDAARAQGADVLVTHSHGRQAAHRLDIPLIRVGFPIFDRLGTAHTLSVGYRGTRDLIFRVANLFTGQMHDHVPADFADVLPAPIVEESSHVSPPATH